MHWRTNWFPVALVVLFFIVILDPFHKADNIVIPQAADADCWTGAGVNQIPVNDLGNEIRYGRSLIENTAYYFGPKGIIAHSSNGMNCQNCHLEAGTKPWGNNFGAVASTYPRYRERSGTVESIEKRVNDCFERSLNGKVIDSTGPEMHAMVAYIKWLGAEVPKHTKPKGSGSMQLPVLDRAADPVKGAVVYSTTCARCHGKNGEGQKNINDIGFAYPPLWGADSYNTAAGMYRISGLAGFVRNNMPNPLNYHHPELSNEQAWDVAAFVNSQPRPEKVFPNDWPDIKKKPFDYPFGPYADKLSVQQHKYGPFEQRSK